MFLFSKKLIKDSLATGKAPEEKASAYPLGAGPRFL